MQYNNTSHYVISNIFLEMYIHDIDVGTTVNQGEPSIIKEGPATALVDGNNLLGPVSNKSVEFIKSMT